MYVAKSLAISLGTKPWYVTNTKVLFSTTFKTLFELKIDIFHMKITFGVVTVNLKKYVNVKKL